MDLSIIIPCLNEELTIRNFIYDIYSVMSTTNIKYELIVVDNNSIDNSKALICQTNVIYINNPIKGYGATITEGINNAKGKYSVMLDCDYSYNIKDIITLYDIISNNNIDLIIGNRYEGGIEKKAMPLTHKYFGTPILSLLGRSLWKNNIYDYNCGIRIFNTQKIKNLNLKCKGMEYASEMIIKASITGYNLLNYPTKYFKDKRNKKGNLKPISDGLKHLKIILGFFK